MPQKTSKSLRGNLLLSAVRRIPFPAVHAMDPDEEIEIDFSPFLIVYKSGRVQRFGSTSRKNAGTDDTTGVTSKDAVIDAGTGLAARLFLPKGAQRGDEGRKGRRRADRRDGAASSAVHGQGSGAVGTESTDPAFPEIAQRNWRFVCAGKYGIDHPFINPLAMPPGEWAALGCRRALVTTGELDCARDRGRTYGAWGGEEAALYETEGEDHLYYFQKRARSDPVMAEKAANEMAAVASFIKRGTRASDCNIRSTL